MSNEGLRRVSLEQRKHRSACESDMHGSDVHSLFRLDQYGDLQDWHSDPTAIMTHSRLRELPDDDWRADTYERGEETGMEDMSLETKTFGEIVAMIVADWEKVNYAAVPYLKAMREMNSVDADYFADSGHEVLLRFLGNASSWRGDVARAVKKELKRRMKP